MTEAWQEHKAALEEAGGLNHWRVTVREGDVGKRIDRFVADSVGISRSAAQQWIQSGYVLADGKPVPKSFLLRVGESLDVSIPPLRPTDLVAQDIPLEVVFEDKHLLVVNKPKGMVVHPANGNPDGTLVNALLYHCRGNLSGIGGEIRPGIVHRIDKDTSGLLVVAKDDATHHGLAEQFFVHSITRVYQAVVYGHMREAEGQVDAPIGRNPKDRKKMAVYGLNSKDAVTDYRVEAEYPGFSHLSLRLHTGRTHQIRVHMASLGHPVAGDAVYGPRKVLSELRGQCLFAGVLGFEHPITGQALRFEAPLPEYFTAFLEKIGKGS